ncbi:MAG: hypothetical protein JXB50_02150 [Spirochaetes bacterium]|nr:hypothetical protein [Spirochaetota bacterium]
MNIILGIDEFLNVWANDAHKLSVLLSLIYLPFLFRLFFINFKNSLHSEVFSLQKVSFFTKINVEIVYLISVLSLISGFSGIGQLYLNPYIDIVIRAAGIVFLSNGLLLFHILIYVVKEDKNTLFHKTVRHPECSLLIVLSLGISMIMVNLFSLAAAVLLYLLILTRVRIKEKIIIKNDMDYIDYKSQVPALFPSLYKKIALTITKLLKK